MLFEPGETPREPRIRAGNTRLLQRERHQAGCIAVRALRRGSRVALLPRAERLQGPASVGFLFTPDFFENCLPLGAWKKRDAAPPAEGSNCYATGLVAFTLQ